MRSISKISSIPKPQKKNFRKHKISGLSWLHRILLTVLVICVSIVAFSISWLVEKEVTFTAKILPVENGYRLDYDLLHFTLVGKCEYQTGDLIHVDDKGNISKRGIPLKIENIEQNGSSTHLICVFDIKDIPYFFSVSEYIELYESGGVAVSGQLINNISITGKIVAGRFVQSSVRLY